MEMTIAFSDKAPLLKAQTLAIQFHGMQYSMLNAMDGLWFKHRNKEYNGLLNSH
jgi:hypothetical protein